jgi:hypothetical protein
MTVPGLLATSHADDPALLLRAFKRVYTNGRNTAVPLALSSGLLFSYAAYASNVPRMRLALGAAGALCAAIVPFTVLVMAPGIKVLMQAEASIEDRKRLGPDGAVRHLVAWAQLNLVRAALVTAGSATALWIAVLE